MTCSNSTRSCATCWSTIATPSSSTAMMNVSRNWPSGIIGRISIRRGSEFAGTGRRIRVSGLHGATPGPGYAESTRPAFRRSHQRLPTDAPASTPGSPSTGGSADGTSARASAAAPARGPGRARRRARGEGPRARAICSRKRTSAFVGWTFTSTRSGAIAQEQMHLRAALLDRRDAVGLGDRVRDRAVLDDAAIDEDVLGAADGPWSPSAATYPSIAEPPASLRTRRDRAGRRTAERTARAGAAGGHSSSVRPPLVSVKPTSG